MKQIRLLVGFACLLSLAGCRFFKGNPYQNTPTTGITTICTDQTFQPIIEAELDVFKGIYGYTELNSDYLPENVAFQQLMDGKVEMIIASRPLSANEMAFLKQKKIFPRQTKIATDAIALVVSPKSVDTLLTLPQIKEVLTGKIRQWSQLNASSKSGEIKVVFDNPQSGILHFMNDSICGGKMVKDNLFALDYNRDVIDYVSTHPGYLGFIGGSWISNSSDSLHLSFHKKIKVVAVSESPKPNSDNTFKPYQAYLIDHLYPLSRDLYIINAEPRNGLATGFSAFVASDKGQRIILKAGILPAVAPTRVVNTRSDL